MLMSVSFIKNLYLDADESLFHKNHIYLDADECLFHKKSSI